MLSTLPLPVGGWMVDEKRNEQLRFSCLTCLTKLVSLPVLWHSTFILESKAPKTHRHSHTNFALPWPLVALIQLCPTEISSFSIGKVHPIYSAEGFFYFLTFVCLLTTLFRFLSPQHLHRRRRRLRPRGCNTHTLIFRLFLVGFSFSLFLP